ncbi:hypothetical protein SAMN05216503_0712 [Polaribacter sp. KT25b]|uniref:hypothetical protein n=1 Tax=Polaribacter sp. KT25b TaxID=1855336 RepID=UPI0008792F33|nr:hypothetical protein [Polaribacter sp. KT25b]SDR74489.1 hypothetical protein SAMN05216503_0712 [Polaribacter sp. KT25b]
MKKFRLPRKIKKKLSGLWLYPKDEKGNSLMAHPKTSQEDYTAVKQGLVHNILDRKNSRKRSIEFHQKIDVEISISDELLKKYVDDYFREDVRIASYQTLINAKNNLHTIKYYFNFINAYQLNKKDGSYSNIPALAVEQAQKLLKKKYIRKNNK